VEQVDGPLGIYGMQSGNGARHPSANCRHPTALSSPQRKLGSQAHRDSPETPAFAGV